MSSKYYGSRVESTLGETQHDIYGDDARSNFSTYDIKNERYEHKHIVDIIDENATDFYYNKQKILRKIQKNTQQKNIFLKSLLKKRDFTKKEEKLFKELSRKKIRLNSEEHSELRNLYKLARSGHQNIDNKKRLEELIKIENGMTYNEDLTWDNLYGIRFSNDNEKKFKKYITGIDKIYYYKNAYFELKQSNNDDKLLQYIEWNKTITRSKEPKWTNEILQENKSVTILVVKEDLVDFCKKKNKKTNSVIVNTASHLNPGGSWEKGEEGSEESLFYRSSYELSLNGDNISDGFYPLVEEATIYSPRIMVYKYGKSRRYESLPQKESTTMISIIACCLPNTIEYKIQEKILTDKCAKMYKDKIKNIFQTALFWGHDSIIFDSFGCTNMNMVTKVFPSINCANLFKEVIFNNNDMFYKKFKNISFCINIRDITKIPKPTNTSDSIYFIYNDELQYYQQENNTFKNFHRILHDIDKFSE